MAAADLINKMMIDSTTGQVTVPGNGRNDIATWR
jgi:hypothetical protein